MKNKILLLLISTFLFIGCGDNKKAVEPLAGSIQEDGTVKDLKVAPADMSLTVINNTGHDLVGAQTWCMTGACDTPIPNGAKVKLESNMVDANTITIKMYPPADIDQPNPTTGIFQMNYQYWEGMAHVVCDNECNHGNPTASHPSSQFDNWLYVCEWAQDPSPKKGGINNTVTLTVKAK